VLEDRAGREGQRRNFRVVILMKEKEVRSDSVVARGAKSDDEAVASGKNEQYG